MDSNSSTASRQAQGKWGSACAVCSAAKAKCIRSDPSSDAPCDRCKRLSKDCTSQVHLPRKKRITKATRTAHLEERLNSLVDLLRASGEISTAEAELQRSSPQTDKREADTVSTSASLGPNSATSEDDDEVIDVPSAWNSHGPPRCVCRATHGKIVLRRRPDDQVLEIFQTHLMPVFPFVVIPSGTQADRLKVEKPFLFEAISMASSIYDIRAMRGRMYRLIQRITNQIIMTSTKSMDILQALLVMLAWHQNHCVLHAQMNNLLHLAQSQMADLLLHREPGVHERTGLMVLNIKEPPPRTNEEKRVALGVWFLTSCISSTLEKLLPMKFSRHLMHCLAELEANPEYESDVILVHLVRAQHLTQQISDWQIREEEEQDAIPGIHHAPASAYRSAFEGEIKKLRSTLPPKLKDHKLLDIHLASTLLHLYQPPPIKLDVLKSLADSSTFLSATARSPSTLDVFYSAQSALQGFFDSLFTLPTTSYPVMPIYTMLDVLWSVPMLARWAKIMGPGRARPVAGHNPPDILTAQKVLWDPSADHPARGSGSGSREPVDGQTASRDVNAPSAAQQLSCLPPTIITDPSQIPVSEIHDATDAKIPRAIVSLREKLQSQSGLNLDIIGILSTLGHQCEKAHQELVGASPDVAWQNDIWFLCSKKVLIARAKLEKWADIVAAGGVAEQAKAGGLKPNSRDADVQMEDAGPKLSVSVPTSDLSQPISQLPQDNGLAAFPRDMGAAGQGLNPPNSMYNPYMYDGSLWTDDMFVPLDPSFWVNDLGDWSAQDTTNIF